MTYRGHIRNGNVVFDEPANLPEGAEVEVELIGPNGSGPARAPAPAPTRTIWEELRELAGTVEGLPSDASTNHDHYLYGTPKRKT